MSVPVAPLERYSVNIADAEKISGISRDVLYKHIKAGTLPASRQSRNWVIVLTDLHTFIEEQKDNR